MTKIIAVANQKGGVGKTTTVANLGHALAELDYLTLMIDLDPQASLTIMHQVQAEGASMAEVLGGSDPGDLSLGDIARKISDNLWLAPSDIALASEELGLVQRMRREYVLTDVLATTETFDYVLIDCPPSLGLLTLNALTAADGVIIPTQCEYLALRGIALFYDTLNKVWGLKLNPDLLVLGILVNFYDNRLIHHREIIEALEKKRLPIFETRIRRSIRFSEAATAGEPFSVYDPKNPSANAFRELAEEVVSRG